MATGLSLSSFARTPSLRQALFEHARRSLTTQLALRAILVCFVIVTVVLDPPAAGPGACFIIVFVYAAFSVVAFVVARRSDERMQRLIWSTLFVDLLALTALIAVASISDAESWTANILLNGFFVIPMLVTTQLRMWVAIAITLPTAVVYGVGSTLARTANEEPWSVVILRIVIIAALCLGSVLLVLGQRSRVFRIGRLVESRSKLLVELLSAESRERRDLSEALHDGALQYVLAAIQDLDDTPAPLERVDVALREAAGLLRATVSQLHPAVLEQVGLSAAIKRLVDDAGARGRFTVTFADVSDGDGATDATGPASAPLTPADRLLYDTARELLTNVTKHAGATTVHVWLSRSPQAVRLIVEDDGCGIPTDDANRSLAAGHIGISSRRARIDAAGGQLRFESVSPPSLGAPGTRAVVELPAEVEHSR